MIFNVRRIFDLFLIQNRITYASLFKVLVRVMSTYPLYLSYMLVRWSNLESFGIY